MKSIYVGFFLSFLLACSSAKKATEFNNGGKTYQSLFVIANTADIMARVRLEKEFVAAAELKGHKVLKSLDVISTSLTDPKPPSIEEFTSKLNESSCDASIIVYYFKKDESVEYTPGKNFKGTDPIISGLVSGLLGYNGNFEGTEYKKNISTSGSYSKEGGFYISSFLIDWESKKTIYSEKSELFNDADLDKFCRTYMTGFVKHLAENNFLKK